MAPTRQVVVTYDDDFLKLRDGPKVLQQDDKGSEHEPGESDHEIEVDHGIGRKCIV